MFGCIIMQRQSYGMRTKLRVSEICENEITKTDNTFTKKLIFFKRFVRCFRSNYQNEWVTITSDVQVIVTGKHVHDHHQQLTSSVLQFH